MLATPTEVIELAALGSANALLDPAAIDVKLGRLLPRLSVDDPMIFIREWFATIELCPEIAADVMDDLDAPEQTSLAVHRARELVDTIPPARHRARKRHWWLVFVAAAFLVFLALAIGRRRYPYAYSQAYWTARASLLDWRAALLGH